MKDFFMFFTIVVILSCIGDIIVKINNTLKEILEELKINNNNHKDQN